MRRPDVPDIAAQRAAVLLQPGAAAFAMEIILIPEAMLLRRRHRLHRRRDILDVVAIAADETAHALRPQRGDHTGRAAAPVVTGEHGALDFQRVHYFAQIVA